MKENNETTRNLKKKTTLIKTQFMYKCYEKKIFKTLAHEH